LCFRAQPDPVLIWVALLPACWLLLDRERGAAARFFLGWLHGTVSWAIQVPWISATVTEYGGLPGWLGALALLLLAGYLGIYHGLWMWLGGLALRRWRAADRFSAATVLAGVASLAALWVALEGVRGWLFSGFPWNLAGYGAVTTPGALETSSVVGALGISFCVVAVNVGLAMFAQEAGAVVGRRRLVPLVPLAAVAASFLFCWWLTPALWQIEESRLIEVPADLDGDPSPPQSGFPVRLLQPNSGIVDAGDQNASLRSYGAVIEQLDSLCDRPGEGALAIAPESAFFPYTWQYHGFLRRDLTERLAPDCGLIMNSSIWQDDDTVFNAALLIRGGEIQDRYLKNHLVPYGEYVPMREYLPFLDTIARQAGGFSSSDQVELLSYEGESFGLSICFEIVFGGEVAARTQNGASTLVTITNDAWYGNSWAPYQHLRAARFRAAENARPLLRSALTGISALVDERGRLVASLGVGERGLLVGWLSPPAPAAPLTFYSRFPRLVELLSTALAILTIVFGAGPFRAHR
jgi:apolipoprotein N-acyltransferase